ncbi:PREDICTED: endochitinase-like [Rhagoletis zephyria]|uniref:endochitinase-like n=1 Tax=Rhagoletis zephyria TaxID=28612 RepID=UPI000811A6EF|nr:PREDICTED: endochitinase-like [Rhagoletis zephyria]
MTTENSTTTTRSSYGTTKSTTTEGTTPLLTSTTTETSNGTTAITPQACETLPTGTFLPDPDHCSRYYVCTFGRAILMHCPHPLWFDTRLNVCNYPENVTCAANKD